MNVTVKGKLIARLEKREGDGANGAWVARSIVVETEGDYPQQIKIDFFGEDKVALLEDLKKDQDISVSCNLKGRAYKDNWFVSLGGWKIEGVEAKEAEAEPEGENLPF